MTNYKCARCQSEEFSQALAIHIDEKGRMIEGEALGSFRCQNCGQKIFVNDAGDIGAIETSAAPVAARPRVFSSVSRDERLGQLRSTPVRRDPETGY